MPDDTKTISWERKLKRLGDAGPRCVRVELGPFGVSLLMPGWDNHSFGPDATRIIEEMLAKARVEEGLRDAK